MAERISYRGVIIASSPNHMPGKTYSASGGIEVHTGEGVYGHLFFDPKSQLFDTEEDADYFFIESAKKIIDHILGEKNSEKII